MFDVRELTDEQLQKMREEITRTRANPIEQLAAIVAFSFKTVVDQELARRKKPAEKQAEKPKQ